ncbi:MAG TPA: site-specific DNA-methyltransferase [Treponemataceae bacterium]|nr:site-specific DNA-methyltransferase [Treponemataceae bacterium]
MTEKTRAPRNRTLTLSAEERAHYGSRLVVPGDGPFSLDGILDRTVNADLFEALGKLPPAFADLLVIDPPYNLDKDFHGMRFSAQGDDEYLAYVLSWFPRLLEAVKPTGSVYLCGDWRSALSLYRAMEGRLVVRNRITWQREKGRGAKANWKNSTEDIWFGTMGNDYWFDVDAVKVRRRVIAPYREGGKPKDWEETDEGRFRLTHPGNFWDDVSVPYWSMPENTDHPTQKPEKLIAKLVLASCPPGGVVLDPFLGSGTTSVVAKKLCRHFVGVERNAEYCAWAEKRLALAESDPVIQGYEDGVFWERNARGRKRAR